MGLMFSLITDPHLINIKNDNWSTSGNSNPYAGKSGTNTYKGTCSALSLNC